MSLLSDPHMWHPIARSDDLVLRHVYAGKLLGEELAVWRADDGYVNVWEDRCLHRGVRLTIGANEGRELRCRYHGWRYANRTGGCTYIPAHPADAPARTICNRTFPAVERHGLVWTTIGDGGEPPQPPSLMGSGHFGLRNVPVNAEPDAVLAGLAEHRFGPMGGESAAALDEVDVDITDRGEGWVQLTATDGAAADTIVFFVQPVDAGRAVIRPVLCAAPAAADRLPVLEHHNFALAPLVERLEVEAEARGLPEPLHQTFRTLPVELADIPRTTAGREPTLRVEVAHRARVADEVVAFELRPVDGQLPTCQPGAHIDVHLPNGLIRQYSLVNGPGELDRYVIGVKREPESRGGSAALHDDVREGDVLAISEPHNNFPLRRDAFETILVAGGIGITPLLSMAQTLAHERLPFRLHYFVRSEAHVAFPQLLERLGPAVTTHVGLDPDQTGAALRSLLAAPGEAVHAYLCGPAPMLDAARRAATDAGWDDHAVHFEYFANVNEIDDTSSFTVELARSALTLPVEAGETIVDVLRANGVAVATSCEQGACGTCLTRVIDGTPDHQDAYLNASERATGEVMMICVSRAVGDRLVLDR